MVPWMTQNILRIAYKRTISRDASDASKTITDVTILKQNEIESKLGDYLTLPSHLDDMFVFLAVFIRHRELCASTRIADGS